MLITKYDFFCPILEPAWIFNDIIYGKKKSLVEIIQRVEKMLSDIFKLLHQCYDGKS